MQDLNLSGRVVLLNLFTHSQSNTEMNSIQIEVALKKYTTVYEFISLGLNSESFLIVVYSQECSISQCMSAFLLSILGIYFLFVIYG